MSSRAQSEETEDVLDDAESENEATDTPLSSQHARSKDDASRTPATPAVSQSIAMADDDDDDEDDEVPIMRKPVVRNMRAGFIIESDSE